MVYGYDHDENRALERVYKETMVQVRKLLVHELKNEELYERINSVLGGWAISQIDLKEATVAYNQMKQDYNSVTFKLDTEKERYLDLEKEMEYQDMLRQLIQEQYPSFLRLLLVYFRKFYEDSLIQ